MSNQYHNLGWLLITLSNYNICYIIFNKLIKNHASLKEQFSKVLFKFTGNIIKLCVGLNKPPSLMEQGF